MGEDVGVADSQDELAAARQEAAESRDKYLRALADAENMRKRLERLCEERIWQEYWGVVYNRIERGLGWILVSIAGIFLIIYGGFQAIEEIIEDPNVGLIFKIGLLVLLAGLAILFVSVLRERIHFWRRDRYKDVRR